MNIVLFIFFWDLLLARLAFIGNYISNGRSSTDGSAQEESKYKSIPASF